MYPDFPRSAAPAQNTIEYGFTACNGAYFIDFSKPCGHQYSIKIENATRFKTANLALVALQEKVRDQKSTVGHALNLVKFTTTTVPGASQTTLSDDLSGPGPFVIVTRLRSGEEAIAEKESERHTYRLDGHGTFVSRLTVTPNVGAYTTLADAARALSTAKFIDGIAFSRFARVVTDNDPSTTKTTYTVLT